MNSNYGKGSSGSLNNFDFDLGIGSHQPKSLNDQKNKSSPAYSSYSSTTTSTQPKPPWQPNKPSWTHQPSSTDLSGPTSMVGDIFGKSWSSTTSVSGTGIGIVEKNTHLFGDLLSSAMGQESRSNSNVPLKNSRPTTNRGAYSMGNLADSLPKMSNSAKSGGSLGSSNTFGGYSGGYSSSNVSTNVNSKDPNLGGPSVKSMSGGVASGAMGGNRDPFGSLVDLASKQQSTSFKSATRDQKSNVGDDSFGDFQNASKSSQPAFPSGDFSGNKSNFSGSNIGITSSLDDFGIYNQTFSSQKQPSVQTSGSDLLDMFSSFSSGGTAAVVEATTMQSSQVDGWGLDSDLGGCGNDNNGTTTELEGLPPPPAGVTASSAKNKGMDHQKQGQYADAIKWLSWAVVLLGKTDDNASSTEVLSCRASCYKEVGEYKKAVADCSKMLEHDNANVSVLAQRALLYESMEKYKLGAEDLRAVLKIDPVNRIARSTIHRLTQMAG